MYKTKKKLTGVVSVGRKLGTDVAYIVQVLHIRCDVIDVSANMLRHWPTV